MATRRTPHDPAPRSVPAVRAAAGRDHKDLPVVTAFRQHEKVEQFNDILREHDYGSFARSAGLVDEALTDDRIAGVLAQRTAALKAAPLHFKEVDDSASAKEVAEILGGTDRQQGLWRYIASSEVQDALLKWGLMVGIGLAKISWREMPWKGRKHPLLLPSLEVWHPRWIRWDQTARVFMVQTADSSEVVLPRPDRDLRGDSQWFVFCPYGVQYGWNSALIRSLGLKYHSRSWNEVSWDRNVEREGMAIIEAQVPTGALDEHKDAFFRQMSNLGSEPVVLCPQGTSKDSPGYGVNVKEFTARTWEAMKDRKTALDTDIAVLMLGQNTTTEVGDKGSYAIGKIQNLVRLDKLVADAELGPALRAQVLTWFAEWNFGDPELAPWPTFEVQPPDDEAASALALKTFGEGLTAVKTAEPRLDVTAMVEERGYPLISEEEMAAIEAEEEEAAAEDAEAAAAEVKPPGDAGEDADAKPPKEPAPGAPGARAAFSRVRVAMAGDGWWISRDGDGRSWTEGPFPSKEEADRVAASPASPALEVKKRYTFAGLPIAVENMAESIRLWQDPEGKTGSTRMLCDYGFIEGYLSGDGEDLDVYVGPDPEPREVYVIHQQKAPDYRAHDEDKVMLGFVSAEAAKSCFLAHRDDGERAFGGMSVIPIDRFKAKLNRRGSESTRKIHASAVGGTQRALMELALAGTRGRERAAFKRTAAGQARVKKFEEVLLRKSVRAASKALAPYLADLKDKIEKASSLKEVEKLLLAELRGADPGPLGEALRRMRVLSKLAGMDQARQEV